MEEEIIALNNRLLALRQRRRRFEARGRELLRRGNAAEVPSEAPPAAPAVPPTSPTTVFPSSEIDWSAFDPSMFLVDPDSVGGTAQAAQGSSGW